MYGGLAALKVTICDIFSLMEMSVLSLPVNITPQFGCDFPYEANETLFFRCYKQLIVH